MPELSTFEDFAQISDGDIQRTMRHVEQNTLVVALKACSGQTRDKILRNMSGKVRGFITDEMENISSTATEIEEAQRAVVDAFDPA